MGGGGGAWAVWAVGGWVVGLGKPTEFSLPAWCRASEGWATWWGGGGGGGRFGRCGEGGGGMWGVGGGGLCIGTAR